MKQACVIDAGVVVNTLMLDDDADPADFGAMLGPDGVGIGWSFNGTDWIAPANTVVPVPSLENIRSAAKASVDAGAEAYRLTYITGGSGQAMAYQQKLEEAKAYLADLSLTTIECPHVFAEIGITGETAEAVAQVVVGMHAAWQVKSAEIERKRLAAKVAIDVGETAEAISAAAEIDWGA
ncbi:MAG: hypothetical protein H6R00_592 [Proteobacteria bacterium]|nr:hypothetical protein [Pseudomonadota bacterium]